MTPGARASLFGLLALLCLSCRWVVRRHGVTVAVRLAILVGGCGLLALVGSAALTCASVGVGGVWGYVICGGCFFVACMLIDDLF